MSTTIKSVDEDGDDVGSRVGGAVVVNTVGERVDDVIKVVGAVLGAIVGSAVEMVVCAAVGALLGPIVVLMGLEDGDADGLIVGVRVVEIDTVLALGSSVGVCVGRVDGAIDDEGA